MQEFRGQTLCSLGFMSICYAHVIDYGHSYVVRLSNNRRACHPRKFWNFLQPPQCGVQTTNKLSEYYLNTTFTRLERWTFGYEGGENLTKVLSAAWGVASWPCVHLCSSRYFHSLVSKRKSFDYSDLKVKSAFICLVVQQWKNGSDRLLGSRVTERNASRTRNASFRENAMFLHCYGKL